MGVRPTDGMILLRRTNYAGSMIGLRWWDGWLEISNDVCGS